MVSRFRPEMSTVYVTCAVPAAPAAVTRTFARDGGGGAEAAAVNCGWWTGAQRSVPPSPACAAGGAVGRASDSPAAGVVMVAISWPSGMRC